VAISNVDDYVYRPEKYEHMSLYDWIRLATKYKMKNKKKIMENSDSEDSGIEIDDSEDKNGFTDIEKEPSMPQNVSAHRLSTRSKNPTQTMLDSLDYEKQVNKAYLRGDSWAADTEKDIPDDEEMNLVQIFKAGHQQLHTHAVQIKIDDDSIVPNFVGGSLPRCDHGDREYYCCTMLTLFKPWQSGKDLKLENQSWDESFVEYEFSQRQQEIIKYFNVRYECLDVCDDYSSKRMSKNECGIFPQWITDDILEDLDNEKLNSGENFEVDDQILDTEYDRIGEKGQRTIEQMMDMDNIIKECGWLNDCVDGVPVVDLTPAQPEVLQGASKWDAAVQAK